MSPDLSSNTSHGCHGAGGSQARCAGCCARSCRAGRQHGAHSGRAQGARLSLCVPAIWVSFDPKLAMRWTACKYHQRSALVPMSELPFTPGHPAQSLASAQYEC